jgi:anti-sigma-K factor RskA
MNMTDEQRKEYNLQEGIRLQEKRERDAAYRADCQSKIKFWSIVALLAAVATVALTIV